MQQSHFAIFQTALVRPVLHLHTYGAAVAHVRQYREEPSLIDIAHTGQLGGMKFVGVGYSTHFIEAMPVELHIFSVNMEEPVGKVPLKKVEWVLPIPLR